MKLVLGWKLFQKKYIEIFWSLIKSVTFAVPITISGSVVQLVRIRACHACGRGFESRPDRHNSNKSLIFRDFFFAKMRDQRSGFRTKSFGE
jgi:hypothetical protein